jgi:hypothetical protein
MYPVIRKELERAPILHSELWYAMTSL